MGNTFKVKFIENKYFSAEELFEVLRPAREQNRHANFGPVSLELEETLRRLNGNNDQRSACCACSGSIALQAVVATFANTYGRPLRWAVSDFGFFTNFTGPFTDQTRVACRPDGFISLSELARIPLSDYDAVLATNVFGMFEDFDTLFDFCRTNNKALAIDNAAGFRALAPYHSVASGDERLLWAEIVSLHQTKPWGMGEGGAAFLPAALRPVFCAAINYGIAVGGKQLDQLELCTNGKMSEVSAAQILLRVHGHASWTNAYRDQAWRIMQLGLAAGLRPLKCDLPERAVPGHIAFLANVPVPIEKLHTSELPMCKYYYPGRDSGVIARDIFKHVINVPCHPQISEISDEAILRALRHVAN